MARYADTLLSDGERIILRTRQHWLATIIDGRYPWLILVASLVALFFSQNLTGTARDLLGYLVLAGIVISIAWLIRVYWNWWAQDYMVTNRRVLLVEGIINKRSADSSLEKINDAVLEQNLFGRLLNYGDLDILTAADSAIDRYRMLNAAPEFKRQMLNQKHELEGEFSRMPAPPLRAAGVPAPAPVPVPEPALASANGAPAPADVTPLGDIAAVPSAPRHVPMTADDVTRALASLADLRDRGAITAEEYDRKKDDLLARL